MQAAMDEHDDHDPTTPVEGGQKGVSAADFNDEPAIGTAPGECGGGGRGGGGGDSMRGSIAERRAVKCGFRAEKISPVGSPVVVVVEEEEECPAAFVMIPPGMSPTALLDSPIFLPNSQLSPTTGSFSLPHISHEHSIASTLNPVNEDRGENAGSVFRLKPHEVLDSLPDFSSLENKVSSPCNLAQRPDVDYQALFTVDLPLDFEFSAEFSEENTAKNCAVDSVNDVKVSNILIVNDNCGNMQMRCCSDRDGDKSSSLVLKEPAHGEGSRTHNLFEGDLKETNPPLGMVRTSEDGYNWRKYGQKQVKGSEYPRSYYKCTNPNCQVKKVVERSYDGQITEIIYKGVHSHPKPQPTRRPLAGSALPFDEVLEKSEGGGLVWRKIEDTLKDIKLGCEWRTDCLERTSSASGVTELSEPLSPPTQGKSSVGAFESSETPELSSTLATSHDENDDGVTQRSMSLGEEAYDEESQSKRRKTESSILESNLASRADREPPGKHNHEVPASRNNNHVNLSSGSTAANAQLPFALSRNTHIPKPETQIQDVAPRFGRKQPESHNEYLLRPSFLGSFSNEMKFASPSLYLMKFPPLQNPYASFGVTPRTGSIDTILPDFPMSLPWSLPTSTNISLAGFDYNTNDGKPIGPVQSFLSGQQLKENNMRFLRPKLEQKDDNLHDACLPTVDHANASSSSSSSLYHQVMGNFPS
ncbi:hypothetical protein JRO89_XS04G0028300 [Xanthoceras sorbifolium]|uniref:WRKY domain-containing protein n=1 Tax=Xanthoceras sorbifolium TaxID=99658 RepID=A0ABQ8I3Y8_9ROSI|nr:hypothetical protein JRO89_XS04G0028300 [Xanthoceras sorbifolium]